jgi:hypothetical protein
VGSQAQYNPDVPIGDPLPVYDYINNAETGVLLSDYQYCEWVGSGRTIKIFVGKVTAVSRELIVGEFQYFPGKPVDTTAAVLVAATNGIIPGVGVAPSTYWVLRTNSLIKVDVDPGGEPARQEAQTLQEQIATNLRAD